MNYSIREAPKWEYEWLLIYIHYAHRMPSVSHAYALYLPDGRIVGVVTFGTPASRHVQIGACPSDPSKVIELNRLCLVQELPANVASWFLSRVFKLPPPRIIVSYADTMQGHDGCVYRASNFNYAGWTDMERRTARYDYVVPGKHSRAAYREGYTHREQRRPKIKYWLTTGNRKERHELNKLCAWPSLSWVEYPPPKEHRHCPEALS
jgi:hypothetical protein